MTSHEFHGVRLPDAVSGHPALEFCNTRAGWGEAQPKEYLSSAEAFLLWCLERELLRDDTVARLRERVKDDDVAAEALLETALELREAVYDVALGRRSGRPWEIVAGWAQRARAAGRLVPSDVAQPSGGGLRGELRVLGKLQVWLAMLIASLSSASLFAVFTYIKPYLTDVSGLSTSAVTWVLLLFGAGMTIGNVIGGRLADWKLMPTVIGTLLLMALLFVGFMQFGAIASVAIGVVFLWGLLIFVVVPPLQIRVVEAASEGPNLAATLNQGAFNVGNAGGAWIGGLAISWGVSYANLPLVGATLALLAVAVAMLSQALDRRAVLQPQPAE